MNLFLALLSLAGGIAVLIKGADVLVEGAVGIADKFGVSPLVVGLTIVAMGTSAPEVATSIAAALEGKGDAALGNVYGSNIANLALVGGVCSIIRPISVRLIMLRRELPVMILVALLLWPFLGLNSYLGRIESIALLILFASLITLTIRAERKAGKNRPDTVAAMASEVEEIKSHGVKSLRFYVIMVVIGLVALAVGARLSLLGAVFLGEKAGLSDFVIGCTILAIGTSLPELITSLVAAFKGHDDLSIGNLVGSNIFNTLLVVGCAGVISPFEVSERLAGTDYWIMIAVSIVFLLFAGVGRKISRKDGIVLASIYVGYMVYLLVFTRDV
ncbi:Inner membrane protein YrbG [Anaerohalosphaera lusitana]|uniref:Inner membrane protein YrbG n=1 Tax=Anaerohalosphaera lusitana TaxID=1936003 RepID=A0A1U9NM94_9BACT|nr:calcium/sodium antiporter [Anaerohalosphaera lusitana]AQT69029.1 Inner membrane protein YrbG [Anaerohalosphaera lusitana]